MKWELIAATKEHEVYHLMNDNKKLLSLELNSFSQAARIHCEDEKRVFVIRKEGFLRNRTVIRNEYGVKIGELGQENKDRFISVDNEKFYYTYRNNPLAELMIKDHKRETIVTCALKTAEGKARMHMEDNKEEVANAALLMAVCWYLFLPVAKENVAAFA
jgi:hypothetical protein